MPWIAWAPGPPFKSLGYGPAVVSDDDYRLRSHTCDLVLHAAGAGHAVGDP